MSKMRDAFYDFAEDYEPINAFFGSEQQDIFTRALDMLAIYDDSKTYIVDSELEQIVREMRVIVSQERPYKSIPKLPALRDKFMTSYDKVLGREEKPVLNTIDQARKRVIDVLNTKDYAENYRSRYNTLFDEIRSGAEHCNNVSSLRSYADKAEALKIRLLNEMAKRDELIDGGDEKKTKHVTIKNVANNSSWTIESVDDVERVLAELRNSLLKELEKCDILEVEF